MPYIQKYTVVLKLPEKLKPLLDIAYNLWWTWNPEVHALFQRIDPEIWDRTHHNPIKTINSIGQEKLDKLIKDDVFISHMHRIHESLNRYLNSKTWFDNLDIKNKNNKIAYFSLEYGLHECLPIYSGGLGLLAGEHLKSASDLGIPLTGVGLAYRFGHARQRIDYNGWQQDYYTFNDFYNMPIIQKTNSKGQPIIISIDLPKRKVYAQVWEVKIGRISIYLLDTDIENNNIEDRKITYYIYGGNQETRIQQEILLGIGGIKALKAIDCYPNVCHLNEGHSAFLTLERIKNYMTDNNLSFEEAKQLVSISNIFTTHTPVHAGIDQFPIDIIKKYIDCYTNELGISTEELLNLGRQNPKDANSSFSPAVLALKLSAYSNAVSKLHGKVSRKMWQNLWPNVPTEDVPIDHITNGIHIQSWHSDELARLFNHYLGPKWIENPVDQTVWQRIDKIPNSELYRAHERMKERLVAHARTRLKEQLIKRGSHKSLIQEADEVLDPEALTIGFSRRFATYKRSILILKDLERLKRILNDKNRPVQIIFSGKAHPHDNPGKEYIQQIIKTSNDPDLRKKIIFLEDYDIATARMLVQGVDIWLNTPRRPLEASGTSGMKAAANGVLNFSILDGWWDEGYNGQNGWPIGHGEEYNDPEYQDIIDSLTLYNTLEDDIVPLFYNRRADGIPTEWIDMMKSSMKSICPYFNTNRMVAEYAERFYIPCLLQWNILTSNNFKEIKDMVTWKDTIKNNWNSIKILAVKTTDKHRVKIGDSIDTEIWLDLGNSIKPNDLIVQACYGNLNEEDQIENTKVINLSYSNTNKHNHHSFIGKIPCDYSGRNGFTTRIFPKKTYMADTLEMGLIKWWEG